MEFILQSKGCREPVDEGLEDVYDAQHILLLEKIWFENEVIVMLNIMLLRGLDDEGLDDFVLRVDKIGIETLIEDFEFVMI